MCRFTLYLGDPVLLSSILTEPANSLINQSRQAAEGHYPYNGDGFGVAWYSPEVRPEPARFRSLHPAWSDQNLQNLAGVIRSHCFLAHVRATTPNLPVTDLNCHPFIDGKLSFMHNGLLAGFHDLRQQIAADFAPETYKKVTGTTDSEHLLGAFVDRYEPAGEGEDEDAAVEAMASALCATVRYALDLSYGHPDGPSYLNLAICDGENAVVCRVTDGEPDGARSLHVHTAEPFSSESGEYSMLPRTATLVSSERLDEDPGWEEVPPNHMVLFNRGRAGRLSRMPSYVFPPGSKAHKLAQAAEKAAELKAKKLYKA